ncbi:methyl-accepting chemotaxis protein [Mariprofundus sp. EBB-1]|uniref:methyl-accepting chemotaxis protein n=1 Tax=Mariprofundus sp. EBB-1 TaxID=2650971 RepID=UPI000EF240A8|nr:methyl-accepting chemotaxis protein [Mariprofundus sp. EBB-1]RLL50807.1 methyl-accepting chemotaxis protein [Mariprofundus sp. EBB-1]
MNTNSEMKPVNQVSLKQLANRNFILSLLLFVMLIGIVFFASIRDNTSMGALLDVYDDQFRVGQFKGSISDVMVPINDFTMVPNVKNFAKIKTSIQVFDDRYKNIKTIASLTDKNLQSIDQMNMMMTEVLSIAKDVAEEKIPLSQASQVAMIAQNLVLSAQSKLDVIIKSMEIGLAQKKIEREKQATMQLYILLGFIVLIILLLEFLNRKLLAHAQVVSKASSNVVESAGDIVEANRVQASITEQQSKFMDKVIKGLEFITISGSKIPIATTKLEKNSSVISSFARGGVKEINEALTVINQVRGSVSTMTANSEHISDKANQVLQSIEQIQDVADEANLLALNASIDGGSSMTHDVQRMAEQIRGYANEIRASIEGVTSASGSVEKTTTESITILDKNVEVIKSTSDMLNRIETLSATNGQSSAVIVKAIQLQNERNKKILHVLKHISQLLHSSDDKLQAYHEASSRLTEASESLKNMS